MKGLDIKTKIIVIGASGVLGGLICNEVNNLFGNDILLFVGDYHTTRGENTAQKFKAKFCETNINEIEKLSDSLSDMDIVIIAINQKEPIIQSICIEKKLLCIDVTAFYSFAKKVQELYKNINDDKKPTSLLMVGFFPGLSGLILQKALKSLDSVEDANISLIQNTNAKAGASGILDMLKIISQPVIITYKDKEIRKPGFLIKREINLTLLGKRYKPRLISHSEKTILDEMFCVDNLHYWTAWNNEVFNTIISFLKRTSLLRFITSRIKRETIKKIINRDESKSEETVLIVDIKGYKNGIEYVKSFYIKTFSDYGTTAKITAALAKVMLAKKNQGACLPLEITNLDEILQIINDKRIEYYEE